MSAKGLDEGAADRDLFAWYPHVDEQWAGRVAGEDPAKFWPARFAEWLGTSASNGHGTPASVPGKDETKRYLASLRTSA